MVVLFYILQGLPCQPCILAGRDIDGRVHNIEEMMGNACTLAECTHRPFEAAGDKLRRLSLCLCRSPVPRDDSLDSGSLNLTCSLASCEEAERASDYRNSRFKCLRCCWVVPGTW